jgi:hypothetical protein
MAKRVPAPRPNPRLANPIYDSASKADQHELERLANLVRNGSSDPSDPHSPGAPPD